MLMSKNVNNDVNKDSPITRGNSISSFAKPDVAGTEKLRQY